MKKKLMVESFRADPNVIKTFRNKIKLECRIKERIIEKLIKGWIEGRIKL